MEDSVKVLLELNDPLNDLIELNRLVVKAARRCAYDLGHAASEIKNSEYSTMFHDRHHMWLKVFNPADGGKNYRDELHYKIDSLENRIEKFMKLCDEKGVDYSSITYDDIPF